MDYERPINKHYFRVVFPPNYYQFLQHLQGKVGYVIDYYRHWNIVWCNVPYVRGVRGVKLMKVEINKIGVVEFYMRLVWQFINYVVRK
jgi:hypothetical protein